MLNLSLSNYQLPQKKRDGGPRGIMMGELYQLYKDDRENRRKTNWKNYIAWLKENRLHNTPANQAIFKNTKKFIKEYTISSFCYLLSQVKTKGELPHLLSEAKSEKARKHNVSGYIAGHFSKIKR